MLNQRERTDALLLKITYTETYPDAPPEISLESESGDLTEDEMDRLLKGLESTAQDSIGMVCRCRSHSLCPCTDLKLVPLQAMVFTLTQYLRDSISLVLDERREEEKRRDDERARLEEEVRRAYSLCGSWLRLNHSRDRNWRRRTPAQR